MPADEGGRPDSWYEQQGAPVGVTQYAVERLADGKLLRPEPKAVEIRETRDLEYDSADPSVTKAADIPGAFKEGGKIQLQDSKEWRTYVFSVPDALFSNRCNGADLRLSADAASFAVSRLAVARPDAP